MKLGKKIMMWMSAVMILLQGPIVIMATDRAVGERSESELAIESAGQENEITIIHRTGVTVVDDADFYQGPGTDYQRMSQIPANTNVRISGYQGDWYQIVYDEITGWMSRHNVAQTRQIAVIRGHIVPVRSARNHDAKTLTYVTRGTVVAITRRTENWSQITVNDQTGWIRNNQMTMNTGRRPGRTREETALHIRPDESSHIERQLPPDQEFMILQRTTNGDGVHQGWTQIEILHAEGTQTGWVRTDQVERRTQERLTRGGNRVNVRTGPGTGFGRISTAGRIPRNTQVTVLAEIGIWSRVRFNHEGQRHEGWISNRRLTRISRLPQRGAIGTGTTLLGSITLVSGLAIIKKRKALMMAIEPSR